MIGGDLQELPVVTRKRCVELYGEEAFYLAEVIAEGICRVTGGDGSVEIETPEYWICEAERKQTFNLSRDTVLMRLGIILACVTKDGIRPYGGNLSHPGCHYSYWIKKAKRHFAQPEDVA